MNLIKLTKGKFLSAHEGFVDSWNSIVDFVANLTGDEAEGGRIRVDRSDEANPRIKYIDNTIVSTISEYGNFAYDFESYIVSQGSVYVGETIYSTSSLSVGADYTGYAYVKVNKSTSTPTVTLESATTLPTSTNTIHYLPIYQFASGVVLRDYRGSPMDVEAESSKPGLFEIVSGEFTNCYYSIGGKTYLCTSPGSVPTDGIAALVIDISGSTPSAAVSTYATFAALQTAQADTSKYIIPLYTLADSVVTLDWRLGPSAAMGEF